MYTVDYFINKFQAIPEIQWTTGMWTKKDPISGHITGHCAAGHCGMDGLRRCEEFEALKELFLTIDEVVMNVNDGITYSVAMIGYTPNKKYTQPTPKQRILAALQDIKKLQTPEYQDITSSLASEFVESPESTDVVKQIVNFNF